MAFIYFKEVEFHYEGTHLNIFEHLNLEIDTAWKTGIVAKNGRGKSTLLNLIQGELKPTRGEIISELETCLFPMHIQKTDESVLNVIKTCIGPIRKYECIMEDYMNGTVSEAVYLEALEHYIELGGYELEYLIEKEFNLIGLSPNLISRAYQTLSGGEQTKVQIVALFLKQNTFVLLDEPTNHLDINGVQVLGEYLNKKDGFIVVSHHRDFLDQCINHVVSITKAGIHIEQGDYSSWEYNYDLKKGFEQAKREKIETDIKRLEKTAAQKRNWSQAKEKQKIGAGDKGYIGHKAAKLMKRALSVENRLDKQIEEKKTLIQYRERTPNIKFSKLDNIEKILDVTHLKVGYADDIIIDDFTFAVRKGDRLAITGRNGSGKSTLIKA
ncbi:MAG TPA: Lsa family ABC-F type ribosomal protection protein, partial [Firmicutes bacterium]|nr:Lsa family ABC-F type ribosomal protection protein [Bacillota bacterium]